MKIIYLLLTGLIFPFSLLAQGEKGVVHTATAPPRLVYPTVQTVKRRLLVRVCDPICSVDKSLTCQKNCCKVLQVKNLRT